MSVDSVGAEKGLTPQGPRSASVLLTPSVQKSPSSEEAGSRDISFTSYEQQRYMPALDGLRGVAIALVVTRHLHHRMWDFLSGSVGVTIFFVLSGYLITRLALQEERSSGRVDLTAFYIRRSFRIFPLYYLVLAIYAGLILGTHMMPAKAATFPALLPYYLLYMQELPVWGLVHLPVGDHPFYQSWSLGIEEKFYLVWPLLFVATATVRRHWRLAMAVLLAAACTLQGVLAESHQVYTLQDYGFILYGVVLALLLSTEGLYLKVQAWGRRLAFPAVAVLLLTQFLLIPHTGLRGLEALYAFSFAVVLAPLLTTRGWHDRALSWPALTLLGRISYGVYLVHILCLIVVERLIRPTGSKASGVLAYVVTLLLSSAVAYGLHLGVEKPLVRVGRRLSRRHQQELQHEAGTDLKAA